LSARLKLGGVPSGAKRGNQSVSQHSESGCSPLSSTRLMQAWSCVMVPSVSTPPAQHLHASRVLESRACGHDATYRHTCCDAEQFKSATRTDPPALQCLSSSELPGAPLSREGSNTLYWKRSGLTNRLGVFQVYKKDWVSWPDWLGYCEGKPPVGTFLVFEEAREVVRAQNFSGKEEVRSHPFDSCLSKAVVK
jgi:hypothetical protein